MPRDQRDGMRGCIISLSVYHLFVCGPAGEEVVPRLLLVNGGGKQLLGEVVVLGLAQFGAGGSVPCY